MSDLEPAAKAWRTAMAALCRHDDVHAAAALDRVASLVGCPSLASAFRGASSRVRAGVPASWDVPAPSFTHPDRP